MPNRHPRRKRDTQPNPDQNRGIPALLAVGVGLLVAILGWLRLMNHREGPERMAAEEMTPAGTSEEAPLSSGEWKPPHIHFRPEAGHETRDLRFGCVVGAGMVFLLSMAVLLGITLLVEGLYVGRGPTLNPPPNSLQPTPPVTLPPEPRLEPLPGQQLQQLHAHEDAVLNTYGWVDPQAGTARIPIQRAMQLIAQKGLPAASAPPNAIDEGQDLPSASSSGRVMERVWP